ncbi:MAG TPA: hypothetical protein VL947_02565, partial [Cytophagales bacterium]|nr:hypothetical protein [Cytophagales bacterium]
MKIFVVGSGKLANAILSSNLSFEGAELHKWETEYENYHEQAILVHAGSGRQLAECAAFCTRTHSVFIELSTGLETEQMQPDFPLIICPNTSILILKVLNLLKSSGSYFEGDVVSLTESHQSTKTSAPGTAFSFAESLKFPLDQIRSVRDPEIQHREMGIPIEYLDKHAYHKIVIADGPDQVTIETKVLGHASYAHGVQRIIALALRHRFENRRYA